MKPIDRKTLDALLHRLVDRLDGDWVLLGGSVLPLVGIDSRPTYDIDLAGPRSAPQILELLELTLELDLPPEAVNQAAALFLYRIEGWKNRLLPVLEGSRARVFRPDATLFVLLKLRRLTESDLADCLRYLDFARTRGEPVEAEVLREAVAAELRKRPAIQRKARLRTLSAALGGVATR